MNRASDPPRTRLSVAEALAEVLRDARPLGDEAVTLRAALGRVLAADAVSPVALPPWDNSAMDGWAVRAADVLGASPTRPVALRIADTVAAGVAPARAVGAGEAVRIATGAPLPPSADAVVRIEDADADGDVVRVRDDRDARVDGPAGPRRNVRPRGEDVAVGERVVAPGTRLGAAHLGVLAAIGHAAVRVARRPRVAIVASGDELVDVDRFDEVRDGRRIVTSNSYTLAALVEECGGEPLDMGVAPDEPAALRERMTAALAADVDVVLTTGGVSVGDRDHARATVDALGGSLRFWRVRMRPGGPLAFGTLPAGGRDVPWLGLPGNPVSTMVTFALFARPLLRRLLGDARPHHRALAVTLAESVRTAVPLAHYLRAVVERGVDGALVARLAGPQGSGLLTSMARANALLVVPEHVRALDAGARAYAIALGDALLDAVEPDAAALAESGA